MPLFELKKKDTDKTTISILYYLNDVFIIYFKQYSNQQQVQKCQIFLNSTFIKLDKEISHNSPIV